MRWVAELVDSVVWRSWSVTLVEHVGCTCSPDL
jgi:hypothetical protein